MKGIYGYLDKKDNSIVYVGKDSNLEINKRHYDHLSLWKDYARVIKRGKTKSGKPTYSLRYNGKYLKHSADYDKLQKMADDINKTRLEV